jgi:hypothetical protein
VELTYVRRWLEALREHHDRAVAEVSVLIRPHPFNLEHWETADLSGLGDVAVYPRARPSFPMNEADQSDYYHSLHYGMAVVGVNTSAMIEAAIVGRPVYTVRGQEFAFTQDGTLHFHYLLPEGGGFLRVAHDLKEHFEQLSDSLRRADETRSETTRFLGSFVRPLGMETPCTPILADAIEAIAAEIPSRARLLRWLFLPVRAGLLPIALWLARAERGPGKRPRKSVSEVGGAAATGAARSAEWTE